MFSSASVSIMLPAKASANPQVWLLCLKTHII